MRACLRVIILVLVLAAAAPAAVFVGAYGGWTMDYYNVSAFEGELAANLLWEEVGLLLGGGYSRLEGYYHPDYDEYFTSFTIAGDTLFATLGYAYRWEYFTTLGAVHFGGYWVTPEAAGAAILAEADYTTVAFSAETLFSFGGPLGFSLRVTNSYYIGEPWHPSHFSLKGGLVFEF
jgi:hypothetical protein